MGFSFGSPSSSSKNTTQIYNDSSTKDNRVAAQSADNLIATGGGSYDSHAGANVAGGNLTVNQVDPNSFGFASHLIDQVFGANATSLANARSAQQGATDAIARVAAAAAPPHPAASWQAWAKWGGIVGGVVIGAAVLWRVLRRRK